MCVRSGCSPRCLSGADEPEYSGLISKLSSGSAVRIIVTGTAVRAAVSFAPHGFVGAAGGGAGSAVSRRSSLLSLILVK